MSESKYAPNEKRRFVDFGPIEGGDAYINREYIPLPGGWEYQTKGSGSSWRLLNKKNGQCLHVLPPYLPEHVEQMARDIHEAHSQALNSHARLVEGLKAASIALDKAEKKLDHYFDRTSALAAGAASDNARALIKELSHDKG